MAKRGITTESSPSSDKYLEEIEAQRNVYLALRGIDQAAQLRILNNSADMLGLTLSLSDPSRAIDNQAGLDISSKEVSTISSDTISDAGESDGINPVAIKWMRRSGLTSKDLQPLFSLGIEEIDLVAKAIPGKSIRERLKNVLLLKGVAAYLSTGVARVTDEQLREASAHYRAYDQGNFAKHMKSLAPEVGGTKTSGYTLTARGLASATELIQQILGAK